MIVPFYLLLFASTYFLMERASAANFTQPLTRTDALYFSVTVFTTVGFGDITAKSETARVVLIVQMIGDLALLGAGDGRSWGRCAAASNEDPAQAPAPEKPGHQLTPSLNTAPHQQHHAEPAARWRLAAPAARRPGTGCGRARPPSHCEC